MKKNNTIQERTIIIEPKFVPERIFDDTVFFYSHLNKNALARYSDGFLCTFNFQQESAINIIDRIAYQFNVNPKLILAVLEKKCNLVTRKDPVSQECLNKLSIWDTPLIETLGRGYASNFMLEIFQLCKTYRRNFDIGSTRINQPVYCADGKVIVANAITYALYATEGLIGVKDLYRKARIPSQGTTVSTTYLWKQSPFGAYKIYLAYISLFEHRKYVAYRPWMFFWKKSVTFDSFWDVLNYKGTISEVYSIES